MQYNVPVLVLVPVRVSVRVLLFMYLRLTNGWTNGERMRKKRFGFFWGISSVLFSVFLEFRLVLGPPPHFPCIISILC